MAWVFSIDRTSYSYDDLAGPASDLLRIEVDDVRRAFKAVSGLTLDEGRVA
jgi:hypothetical protein